MISLGQSWKCRSALFGNAIVLARYQVVGVASRQRRCEACGSGLVVLVLGIHRPGEGASTPCSVALTGEPQPQWAHREGSCEGGCSGGEISDSGLPHAAGEGEGGLQLAGPLFPNVRCGATSWFVTPPG